MTKYPCDEMSGDEMSGDEMWGPGRGCEVTLFDARSRSTFFGLRGHKKGL